ncbi:MAG: hypothetical protein IIC79_01380, partial [Chloroflexi bacterium]|nr:hypothetical protein [Chloroflexota bacterium]
GEDVKAETPEPVGEEIPESVQVSTSNNIIEPDDSSASEEETPEGVTGSKDEEISSEIEPEPETEEVSEPTGSSEPEAKLESVIPDTPEEDVPDWMSEPESKDSASQAVSESSDDDLPPFLQEAGWQEGSGEDQEPEPILSEEDEISSSSAEEELELAPADIPDWMQDMQPEALQDAAESPPSIKEDNLDLITSLDSTPSAASGQDDAPEWLQGFSESSLGSDDSTESDVDDVTPEWLNDLSDDTQKLLSADEDEKGSGVLDSLELQEPIEVEPVSSDDTPESDSEDDAMSWLEGLAAKQGAAEEELVTQPSDRSEDAPEWLSGSEQTGDKDQPSPIETTKKKYLSTMNLLKPQRILRMMPCLGLRA